MCGIVGILAKNEKGSNAFSNIPQALKALSRRGPDYQDSVQHENIVLGHTRLSIIDTSAGANQPFTDPTGNFTIVYNGEFYNYREERQRLEQRGVQFKTASDTEVLLQLYIEDGESCLKKINGCFSFAILDRQKNKLFLARDRMGIKPLYLYEDEDKLIFSSELKGISSFVIDKTIDTTALFTYFQLQYIPHPRTIFEKAEKVPPGCSVRISGINAPENELEIEKIQYYTIPYLKENILQVTPENYSQAQQSVRELLTRSVEKRLVSDVPLGGFLSGGVDSSIISIIAKQFDPGFQTFSIGFPDEPYFDETDYAQAVALKHNISHEVFNINSETLFEHLWNVLDYIDEPFADASALPVYILSKLTRNKVKVALSGDGADELFAGYNKHWAEYQAMHVGVKGIIAGAVGGVAGKLPKSRNNPLANLNRKLARFNEGRKLPRKERYWRWASICTEEEANYLFRENLTIKEQRLSDEAYAYKKLKERFTKPIQKNGTINEVLFADMQLVLPNDMLWKVDRMSMANGLEVRTPFLDHELVDYVFTLPSAFKVNSNLRKKILQETFQDELPEALFNRPKKGFEVPLQSWFKTDLKSHITDDFLSEELIGEQGIFNPEAIKEIKTRLFSSNPGDTPNTTWALIVFQHWWKNHVA